MSEEQQEDLLSEFARPSFAQWRQIVESELAGASFEKKLVSQTVEGIAVQPLYTLEDAVAEHDAVPGVFPFLRGNSARASGFEICQEIIEAEPRELNKALLADLPRGLNVAVLKLDEAGRVGLDAAAAGAELVGAGGVSLTSFSDLATALRDVVLSEVKIGIECGCSGVAAAGMLSLLLEKQKSSIKSLRGFVSMDPLAVFAASGRLPVAFSVLAEDLASLVSWAKDSPELKTVGVDVRYAGDAGGSAVDELGFGLASALEYLRVLEAQGIPLEQAALALRFSFSLGPDFFMEIAKLRAARALWAKVSQICGIKGRGLKAQIHAGSSAINKTKYGPYVNLLRVTTETFAAVLGGADSIHAAAFDCRYGSPSELSRRIARNTQSIIKEETSVLKVLDPAGGSWYLEQLTKQLEEKAWALLQEIESVGGMFKAIETGFAAKRISNSAAKRREALKKGKYALVGSTIYAQPEEQLPEINTANIPAFIEKRIAQLDSAEAAETVLRNSLAQGENRVIAAKDAARAGASFSQICQVLWEDDGSLPRADARVSAEILSAPYEALRDASERYLGAYGHRPQVFLATMGPLRQHKARADFTRGFFLVGGFSFLGGEEYKSAEAAAEEAVSSGAKVVVLCSTDETYPELVAPFVEKVRGSGKELLVVLAGFPEEHVAAFREAGVSEFIHLRCDQGAILRDIQEKLGIK